MKKQYKIFFVLAVVIVSTSCQPDKKQVKAIETLTQDSIAAYAAKANKQELVNQDKEVSNQLKEKAKVDSTEVKFDFDSQFTSTTRVHYDKNEVEWKSEEKNAFRFVYKTNINKLIVYKNNIEFKVYQNPKIFGDDDKHRSELWYKDLTMIYVDGKKILNNSVLEDIEYAPKGFENHSEYYILIPIHKETILEKVLSKH